MLIHGTQRLSLQATAIDCMFKIGWLLSHFIRKHINTPIFVVSVDVREICKVHSVVLVFPFHTCEVSVFFAQCRQEISLSNLDHAQQ